MAQDRIQCFQVIMQAEKDAARWKHKTQAFFLGQPKTKKMYKKNWTAARQLHARKVTELAVLDGLLLKRTAQFKKELKNCSDGLVRLAASAADCGGTAAELCLTSSNALP